MYETKKKNQHLVPGGATARYYRSAGLRVQIFVALGTSSTGWSHDPVLEGKLALIWGGSSKNLPKSPRPYSPSLRLRAPDGARSRHRQAARFRPAPPQPLAAPPLTAGRAAPAVPVPVAVLPRARPVPAGSSSSRYRSCPGKPQISRLRRRTPDRRGRRRWRQSRHRRLVGPAPTRW